MPHALLVVNSPGPGPGSSADSCVQQRVGLGRPGQVWGGLPGPCAGGMALLESHFLFTFLCTHFSVGSWPQSLRSPSASCT